MTAPADLTTGQNVQPVRDALEALRAGTGDYEAVRKAVGLARFAIRPPLRTLEEIGRNWDYVPIPDSFTDTVSVARWQKVLTPEQERELKGLAKFIAPAPQDQES
ncbi:hypothetical protein [Longimicrobium sp.]|jgi:hypothetical protein|uniref:hypothetical protein n=1 Tax=Longimicrobium sp. TaxID=2029185 RepID=UPI002EDBA527